MKNRPLSIGRYFFLYINLVVLLTGAVSFFIAIQGSLSRLDYQMQVFSDRLYQDKQQTLMRDVESAILLIDVIRTRSKDQMEKELVSNVRYAVDIAQQYYNNNRNRYSMERIQSDVVEILRPFRYFSGEGYFFAFTPEGTEMLYPIFPEKEGQYNLDWKDMDGNFFIREMVDLIQREGQGFVQYRIERPGMEGRSHLKTSYIIYMKDLNLIIGSGYYNDNLETIAMERAADSLDLFGQDREEPYFGANYDGLVIIGSNRGVNRIHNPVGASAEIIRDLSAIAQQGGGFYEYEMPPLDETSQQKQKVSYVLPYPDWDWYIGTGAYMDDLSSMVDEERIIILREARWRIILLIGILLFIYLGLLLVIQRISHPIRKAGEKFVRALRISVEDNVPINMESLKFREFRSIAQETNKILSKNRESQRALFQKQKLEAIGRLAGGVAHDINNQLTAIMGYADLLGTQDLSEEAREYLETLLIGAHRASDMVRELLSFSRKDHTLMEKVDVHNTIDRIKQFLERTVDKNIQIKLELNAEYSMVSGDDNKLYSLFLNLVINSVDALEGVGLIMLTSRNETRGDKSWIILQVRDNGVGIPEGKLDKIFDLFFTTKPPGKGTGLGLSLVYDIVKEHQGEISVESNPGEGTVFTVSLPCYIS